MTAIDDSYREFAMRKIKKTFKSPIKINGLKKLLKKVHSNRSNHLAEIAKLNLGKNLSPSLVEKVEIEINSLTGREIITIPHNSLTFLKGDSPPFTEINNNSIAEDKYIVLPWSIASTAGREALKHLINKISLTTISLTYTIYIDNEEARVDNTTSIPNQALTLATKVAPITTSTTTPQSTTLALAVRPADERVLTESIEDFSWSADSFSEDNIEQLSNEIEKLKKEVEDKEKQIADLRREVAANRVIRLNNNAIVVNEGVATPPPSNGWIIDLPAQFTCKAPKLASISSKGNINFGGTAEICYGSVAR